MAFLRSNSNGSRQSARPLPLKQRTSSQDTRRDYTSSTLTSVMSLLKPREFLITVDNFSIWRRHLAWAMENGKDLRTYMTQRYASNMVFMSLLLSTELGVLFNSAAITTNVRHQLLNGEHWSLPFWAGLLIIVSALLTILSLISTFTAWSLINSVDETNAHCILRSSIGQYAVELPGRLIVGSIYSFLISFMLYFFLLLPFGRWSIILLVTTIGLFVHIVSVFSALGRVIMHSGAMGKSRIFTPEYEDFLLPHSLHTNLLNKSRANLENNTSIIRQYRRKQNPIGRYFSEDELYDHLCDRLDDNQSQNEFVPQRSRADSTVRFADEEEGRRSSLTKGSSPRTLTPVSDSGSVRSIETGSSSLEKKTSPTSSITKQGIPGGAMKPPLQTPSGVNVLRNASNSSLDLWLQPSPRNSIEGNDHSASELSFGHSEDQWMQKGSTAGNNFGTPFGHSEDQSLQRSESSPRPPYPPRHVTTNNPIPRPTTPTPSSSQSKKSEREMSEDERFLMDYGDIGDRRSTEQMTLLGNSNQQTYHPYFSTTSEDPSKK